MTCPAARSQQSSCHASLWSRCGCRALRSVVPKVNWILPWTSASKRHLRLGKATYGHERFMITLQQLQNISHDPISGAQVRDLSSVNYTLAVERKELLSTCIMIRLLQVFPWGVNYAYIIFLGGFSSIQKTMGTIRDSTRSCWVATWDWKYWATTVWKTGQNCLTFYRK